MGQSPSRETKPCILVFIFNVDILHVASVTTNYTFKLLSTSELEDRITDTRTTGRRSKKQFHIPLPSKNRFQYF